MLPSQGTATVQCTVLNTQQQLILHVPLNVIFPLLGN